MSPRFETPTKSDTKAPGGSRSRPGQALSHPLVAIGGLNRDNVGAAVAAGPIVSPSSGVLQRSRSRDRGPGLADAIRNAAVRG